MEHVIKNAVTGETTVVPFTPEEAAAANAATAAAAAQAARATATFRITQIRAEMADHLADLAVGNPSEQGTARAALGLLRAELAIEKAKL